MPEQAADVYFLVHVLPRFVSDFGALASDLAGRGMRVTVYAPAPQPGADVWWKRVDVHEAARRQMSPEIQIEPLPLLRDRLSPWSLLKTARLALALGLGRPRAVFFMWTALPVVLCGLPLRLLNRRCVFMLTGLGTTFGSGRGCQGFTRRIADWTYPFLFGGRSRVIVHNSEDRDFLVARFGIDRARVQVTPGCGVDPAEYPWIPGSSGHSCPVVYAPVRLIREKGVQDAVEASALLIERGIDHEMWFTSDIDAGNPTSLTRADLDRFAAMSRAVRFLGYQPSVMDIYRRCDLVCIPTKYREGLPTAILEAASCGRPIVATDNIGCREFVVNEKTGLVVAPGNPEAMADALERLIRDPTLANNLRRAAHEAFLESFTKRVMIDRTLDVLNDLAGAVHPRAVA